MKTRNTFGRISMSFLLLAATSSGCAKTTSSNAPSKTDAQSAAPIVAHENSPAKVLDDRDLAASPLNPTQPSPGKPPRKEEEEEPTSPVAAEEKVLPPEKDPPLPDGLKPLNKEKTLFFEKATDGKRRVYLMAQVCLREGPLEVFLCKLNTKEHESILNVDLDARAIHMALLAAGAKRGTTVKFTPEYKPATGDTIKVSLTYYKDGKLLTKPAQYWVQDVKTKKDMPHDWVFAGSRDFADPENPAKHYYCANNGEVICISNFFDSMMDLPVKSSKDQAELGFIAHTERIPPVKTKVLVTLEPVATKK